jgi:transcriptional regulator with XRE-family HTH domain
MGLVNWLRGRQTAEGLSDTEFARRLDLDPSTWWYLRHGRRGAGRRVIAKVLRAYPEERDALVRILSTMDTSPTTGDCEAVA